MDAQVTEETPVVAPEVSHAIEAPIETEPTTDTTPTTEENFFTEQELQDLLNFKVEEPEITSPQMFVPEVDEGAAEAANPTDILAESLDQMIEELTSSDAKHTEELSTVQAKAEEAEAKASEYQEQINAIEELFSKVQSVIGEDVSKALALGDMDNVPLHYIPENWKRVSTHPVLGPLNDAILKGEDVDVPGFLKNLAESRRASMPNIKSGTPATPVKTEPVNNLKAIIGSMRGFS